MLSFKRAQSTFHGPKLMAVNVVSYEAINGRIVLGKGVVPPVPQEMPAEFKNLPNAELAHDAIRKEYDVSLKTTQRPATCEAKYLVETRWR